MAEGLGADGAVHQATLDGKIIGVSAEEAAGYQSSYTPAMPQPL